MPLTFSEMLLTGLEHVTNCMLKNMGISTPRDLDGAISGRLHAENPGKYGTTQFITRSKKRPHRAMASFGTPS